jgi:hypothetical protein
MMKEGQDVGEAGEKKQGKEDTPPFQDLEDAKNVESPQMADIS